MYNIATKARSLRLSANDISGVPTDVQQFTIFRKKVPNAARNPESSQFLENKTFLTQQQLLEVQTYQKNNMYNIATKARSLRFSVNDISGVPKHVQQFTIFSKKVSNATADARG